MLDVLISRALGEKRVKDNTEVPSNPKIFPVLSRLTNVPELYLYSLTPHALANDLCCHRSTFKSLNLAMELKYLSLNAML